MGKKAIHLKILNKLANKAAEKPYYISYVHDLLVG